MGKLNSYIRSLQDILSCVTCRSSEPNVHRTAPAASGGERAATSSSPQLSAGTESTMERSESGSFSNTEPAIESSESYWSGLSGFSPSEGEVVAEVDNVEVFKTLESHPTWGSFFKTFDDGELVVGKKFAEGGQAEIYHAEWRLNPADRGKPSTLDQQIEISKAHWTQLVQSDGDGDGDGDEDEDEDGDGDEDEDEEAAKERIKEAAKERIKKEEMSKVRNKQVFKELQEKWGETFFYEFEEGEMVMAEEKFAGGTQAEVYYAQIKWRSGNSRKLLLRNKDVLEDRNEYVLKVFRKGTLLEDVKNTLPQAMLKSQKKRVDAWMTRRYNCDVICGTLLEDGRFAFVLQREDTDLLNLIKRELRAGHGEGGGPFPKIVAENFMYEVAKGMEWLHGEGIVHRDLKAENVLVREGRWNYCFVADYECSVRTVGSGFHRAPEILEAVKAGNVNKRPELFTEAADVYGYGMTCYEILTGELPFKGHLNFDPVLIHKQHPKLPEHVDAWVRELLSRCWQFDPQGRPSFKEILNILRENSATIQHHEKRAHPKACQWSHPKTEMIPVAELKKIISKKRKQQIQHSEEPKAQVNWRSQFDNEYEPRNQLQCKWVLKVFKKGTFLKDLELQFPEGLIELHADRCERAKIGPSPAWEKPRYICDILCATLLEDGRFAIVMQGEHQDLQSLMERNMFTKAKCDIPPFPTEIALRMMHDVACGMDWLHSYNIVHRDLKASNVLVSKDARGNYQCFVADFECSVGTIGTGFFRAPEILQACKDRSFSKRPEIFSRAVDVYSYGMLCYEILTGKFPFEDHPTNDYDHVLNGQRPEVPEYVAGWLHELLRRCWQPDPAGRPSFWQIQKLFETAEDDRMERLDEILGEPGFS